MAKPLTEKDELAKAVGYALSAWQSVELGLSLVFDECSKIGDQKRSQMLMATIISIDTRMAVITSMFKFNADKTNLNMWNGLHLKIVREYKTRHKIAHFSFTSKEKNGESRDVLTPYHSFGKWFQYDYRDLGVSEILDKKERYERLAGAVNWFWLSLVEPAKRAIPLPPAPDIIARIQAGRSLTQSE
jgi:hypothetical protein